MLHMHRSLPRAPLPPPTRPQIPLHVFSYKDLYGWTMDEIVREIGTRSNCTFCGVFRRQVRLPGGAGVWARLVGARSWDQYAMWYR